MYTHAKKRIVPSRGGSCHAVGAVGAVGDMNSIISPATARPRARISGISLEKNSVTSVNSISTSYVTSPSISVGGELLTFVRSMVHAPVLNETRSFSRVCCHDTGADLVKSVYSNEAHARTDHPPVEEVVTSSIPIRFLCVHIFVSSSYLELVPSPFLTMRSLLLVVTGSPILSLSASTSRVHRG